MAQCEWLNCCAILETQEQLFNHMRILHVPAISARYQCYWQNCDYRSEFKEKLVSVSYL